MFVSLNTGIPGPRTDGPVLTTALNTVLRGLAGTHWFHVRTEGHADSEALLFPENGIPLQGDTDLARYAARFESLSGAEKLAVRRWTATDVEHGECFDDGTLNLADLGIGGLNFELNRQLRCGEELGTEERVMVDCLSSALRKLPPVRGDGLRVAEYASKRTQPWGRTIRAGDRVTCFPCFMSASSRDSYAATTAGGHVSSRPEPEVLAFFRINRISTGVLLPTGIASLAGEAEILFPRDACFLVRGIAIAEPARKAFPRLRVGVLMEQIPASPLESKNLHTGLPTSAASFAGASAVPA